MALSPPITKVPDVYDPSSWRAIIRDIDSRFQKLEKIVPTTFTVTNYTVTRSLDVNLATAEDLANFVATLVADMIAAGRLGGSAST